MHGPEATQDMRPAVFSLACGEALLKRVCQQLGVTPGHHEERAFEDGEHKLRPLQSVRGRDVYVVQSLYSDGTLSVDEKLLRMLFFLAALRDAGAARLTAVVPYLCYARKDRRTKPRDPVTTRYLATLFEAVGTQRLVTMDVHNLAAYQNAFRIPAEHLTAAPLLVDAFATLIGDAQAVVVSPDSGGAKRAEHFRQALARRLDRPVSFGLVEKFRSEGVVRGGGLVGEVRDRVAIIVDDLISSGTTLVRAAAACREHGARVAYGAVTHGVFSAEASRVLAGGPLERIVLVDTIFPDHLDSELVKQRVQILDCAPLLAQAIQRLHTHGSVSELEDF